MVRQDEHGCLTVIGRCKDVILTNGYNVHPGEIEEVLCAHPAVAQAAVIAHDDPVRGEVPHTVAVLRSGTSASPEELLGHCRTRLARFKLPRHLTLLPVMPLTATGKVDRHALHADTAPRPAAPASSQSAVPSPATGRARPHEEAASS
ncbi:AMP-binding enzyme [Streptomyces vilmorinianum]|uniref:AMP-binding enzyme n=1 Tax=Streptomyces vilmorinianum TaxID=3051092 RepID=UPI0010FAF423|nr:long-chain fatty acid--CoA ligase [Streptomyces vilmorinianum]